MRQTRQAGTVLIENDIYSELRYEGESLPTIKQMDDSGDTILLRSFSKIAFPGPTRGLGHWTAPSNRAHD